MGTLLVLTKDFKDFLFPSVFWTSPGALSTEHTRTRAHTTYTHCSVSGARTGGWPRWREDAPLLHACAVWARWHIVFPISYSASSYVHGAGRPHHRVKHQWHQLFGHSHYDGTENFDACFHYKPTSSMYTCHATIHRLGSTRTQESEHYKQAASIWKW